jgi:adenosine/AMP kinase
MNSLPNIRFGIAFCEASGKRLIRYDGNDDELIKLAIEQARKIGAGHTFIVYIKNAYPINVLKYIKEVPEVVRIFAATANPLQVIVAETEQGRGILGVIDGNSPLGIENEENKKERYEFLRKIGYKK